MYAKAIKAPVAQIRLIFDGQTITGKVVLDRWCLALFLLLAFMKPSFFPASILTVLNPLFPGTTTAVSLDMDMNDGDVNLVDATIL